MAILYGDNSDIIWKKTIHIKRKKTASRHQIYTPDGLMTVLGFNRMTLLLHKHLARSAVA